LCLHSDTPGSVTLAQAARRALAAARVSIAAFAR
jgi:lactam utilization protein B